MGKGGNLCIDNTFILLVPPGVDLYQNEGFIVPRETKT